MGDERLGNAWRSPGSGEPVPEHEPQREPLRTTARARRSVAIHVPALVGLFGLFVGFGLGQLLIRDSTASWPHASPTGTVAEADISRRTAAPPAAVSPPTVTVPLVEGLTVGEARRVLRSVGLRGTLDAFEADATAQSHVVAHEPPGGSRVPRRSVVGLRTKDFADEEHATVRLVLPAGAKRATAAFTAPDPRDHAQTIVVRIRPPEAEVRVQMVTADDVALHVLNEKTICEKRREVAVCEVPFPILEARLPGRWNVIASRRSRLDEPTTFEVRVTWHMIDP